jgi:hypothetical protein
VRIAPATKQKCQTYANIMMFCGHYFHLAQTMINHPHDQLITAHQVTHDHAHYIISFAVCSILEMILKFTRCGQWEHVTSEKLENAGWLNKHNNTLSLESFWSLERNILRHLYCIVLVHQVFVTAWECVWVWATMSACEKLSSKGERCPFIDQRHQLYAMYKVCRSRQVQHYHSCI